MPDYSAPSRPSAVARVRAFPAVRDGVAWLRWVMLQAAMFCAAVLLLAQAAIADIAPFVGAYTGSVIVTVPSAFNVTRPFAGVKMASTIWRRKLLRSSSSTS